jgi:hypothetical protein
VFYWVFINILNINSHITQYYKLILLNFSVLMPIFNHATVRLFIITASILLECRRHNFHLVACNMWAAVARLVEALRCTGSIPDGVIGIFH